VEDLLKDLPDDDAEKDVTPSPAVTSADAPTVQAEVTFKDEEDIKFIAEDFGTRVYPRIRFASLRKLIEFLTHETYADTSLRYKAEGRWGVGRWRGREENARSVSKIKATILSLFSPLSFSFLFLLSLSLLPLLSTCMFFFCVCADVMLSRAGPRS
jgi:hypothetical protein